MWTKIKARLTWKGAKWMLKKNVQSWVMQGAMYGALIVCGMSSLPALISAKATAYIIFVGQCFHAAKE